MDKLVPERHTRWELRTRHCPRTSKCTGNLSLCLSREFCMTQPISCSVVPRFMSRIFDRVKEIGDKRKVLCQFLGVNLKFVTSAHSSAFRLNRNSSHLWWYWISTLLFSLRSLLRCWKFTTKSFAICAATLAPASGWASEKMGRFVCLLFGAYFLTYVFSITRPEHEACLIFARSWFKDYPKRQFTARMT